MSTITYYNTNAQNFYDRTINTDMSHCYKKFLDLLPKKSHILDAGCGSGRDSKYFLHQGHDVTAFDGSTEMVKYATKEIEKQVLHLRFQDLEFKEMFDGVWACASLLHVPYQETKDVYVRIYNALKPGGIFYASYKHGNSYMNSDSRDFYNMDETTILPHFKGLFNVIEIWQTAARNCVAPSPSNTWLNFLVRKI